MAKSLYDVAEFFEDDDIMRHSRELVRREVDAIMPELRTYREKLEGKTGGGIHRWGVQSFFASQVAAHTGNENRDRRIADRQQGRLQIVTRTLR